jgi:hypothetical protein
MCADVTLLEFTLFLICGLRVWHVSSQGVSATAEHGVPVSVRVSVSVHDLGVRTGLQGLCICRGSLCM